MFFQRNSERDIYQSSNNDLRKRSESKCESITKNSKKIKNTFRWLFYEWFSLGLKRARDLAHISPKRISQDQDFHDNQVKSTKIEV